MGARMTRGRAAATQQLHTTTTATTRDAAQINCAAFGEHLLKAGVHVVHGNHNGAGQASSGSTAARRSAALGTPDER